jgi:putative nucleotidyltransferase with HDIG domain
MHEIQSEEPRPNVVGEIISRDVGMAAKILKLVNSSYFGLSVTVSDPVHATKLLGLNTIKALALTHSAFSQFSSLACKSFSIDELAGHSIAAGQLARRILLHEGAGKEEASDANIAGILHDIGQLVLAQGFPEQYDTILAAATEKGRPLFELEKEILGASHAEIGAYLVGVWKLPERIVETVAFHHNPSRRGELALDQLMAVHVADHILHKMEGGANRHVTLDEAAMAMLGLADKMEAWSALVPG